ncbi:MULTISPECIES: hypothetical protein [Streptomyces]|uniref:hypothetical protein n=1 Tax=Streptomyces TaxID=1883 RepID=UPI0004E6A2B1|nr:hypothetical protein [Streptomyces scabiei]KFG05606.1 hypothetical protein IQ61_29425 [Streptomyces scabiei]MDX2829439.1 hypothetical protein [Streptomyces scabiei]MDX3675005.1 hypothetical protein [Streptomyces scabiei]
MTTPDQHRIWITDPEPIEGAPEGFAEVIASLVPASYPHVLVRFEYVIRDSRQVEGPYGVRIQQAPEVSAEKWQPVGAALVRDLPLPQLERAARLAVGLADRTPEGAPLAGGVRPVDLAVAEEEIPTYAEQMVRERHPDADPNGSPAARRRWNRLIRLAEVRLEYNHAIAQNEKAPATIVAEKRGVAPGTVRTWLHQAKQEGFGEVEALSFTDFARRYPDAISHVRATPTDD